MKSECMGAVFVLAAAVTLGGGCRGEGGSRNAAVRTPDTAQLAREGKLLLTDSQVIQALRTPTTPGLIIYDAPVDLSIANGSRTRPDLFGGDTTRRDTSRQATRRDTTGGDATVDTSGGAARRPPP